MRTRYLGLDDATLTAKGAAHLAREICQQPDLWKEIWQRVNREKVTIGQFLQRSMSGQGRIILTGAGTSAFIGKSLAAVFQRGMVYRLKPCRQRTWYRIRGIICMAICPC